MSERGHHRTERAHIIECLAHEIANLLVERRIVFLEFFDGFIIGSHAELVERPSVARIERHAVLDVYLETPLAFLHRLHVVADLALQAHVSHDAEARLGIDARHVAGIGIAVGVTVLHIEVHDEVVTVLDRIAHDLTLLIVFLLVTFLRLMVVSQDKATLFRQRKTFGKPLDSVA